MSLRQPCSSSTRHVPVFLRHNTKRILHSRPLSLFIQQEPVANWRTFSQQANHGAVGLRSFSIGSDSQSQSSRSDVLTIPRGKHDPSQKQLESFAILDSQRIDKAENDLRDLMHRLQHEQNELTDGSQSSVKLDSIWHALSPIIKPGEHHLSIGDSSYLLSIDSPAHHLRKLAPYASFVANAIEEYMSIARNEPSMEATLLSQWCLISSILFGAPSVPATAPSDGVSSSKSLGGRDQSLQSTVQEIPQSRWPAKSTKSRTPHQSKSKLDQLPHVENCQNVFFALLSAIKPYPANEGNSKQSGGTSIAIIERTLAILDSSIQAYTTSHKMSEKSRSLLPLTIQERATKPVIELLARYIEIRRFLSRSAEEYLATSVLGGVSAIPRILYRENMLDIAAKLRTRLQNDQADDVETNNILGSCLLENPENLAFRLNRLMKHKNTEELVFLWQLCSPTLKMQENSATRTNSISLFLMSFLTSHSDAKHQSNNLQALLPEIYSLLPQPTPLPVYHSLLSLYAGINASSSSDRQETDKFVLSSEASLVNLHATWSRMKAEKVTPDIKAYTILITGLGKKGDYQGLQRVWEELINDAECKALWQKEEATSEAYPPIRILNHFISTLFNLPTVTGSSTLALSLFDYVCDPKSPYQPDMFTVNIVLRHHARKKDLDAIIRLMDGLPNFRLAPDLVTYTTLIGGLLDAGRPDTAKNILDVMQKAGVAPNAYVYSLLIADLAKKGTAEAMRSAEALLQQMKAVGLKATAITWTSLASGYFRARMAREGLHAIKRSQDKGIEMTRVGYNMVLRSILYSDMGSIPVADIEHFLRGSKSRAKPRHAQLSDIDTDASLLLLQSMIDNHIEPDIDTWFLVLDSLARQEKWTQADSVIQLMYSRRFVVQEGTLLARLVQQIRNREKARRR